MTDEATDESNDKGKETDNSNTYANKPLSPVKEARSILDEIRKEKEDLKIENDRREDIIAKDMLGGHADAGQSQEKPKEETDHDYRMRIQKEMAEGKTDFGN